MPDSSLLFLGHFEHKETKARQPQGEHGSLVFIQVKI